MNLARIGWLVTVGACLVTVVILMLNRYYGYAGVTVENHTMSGRDESAAARNASRAASKPMVVVSSS